MSTIYEKEALLWSLDEEFADLKAALHEAVGRAPLHEVERMLFRQLQHLGRGLLEWFIAASGTGYEADHPPCTERGKPMTYKGTECSPYWSIFGEIPLTRAAYAHPEGGYYYPLDAQLNRPASKYSYLLQQWLQADASEMDFRQAVARLERIFEWSLSVDVPQRLGFPLAAQVDAFYAQQPPADPAQEGGHLAVSADGKGVPILRGERGGSAPAVADKPRLSKGEKRGLKKEAVVTVDFSFEPQARTPDEMVKALMKQYTPEERQQAHQERRQRRHQGQLEPRQPQHPHGRATLAGKDQAFDYLIARLQHRDPDGTKPIIALVDGKPELETQLRQQLHDHQMDHRLQAVILDIMHASEYVWEVATALYGETHPYREVWVEDHLRALLESRVGRLIGGLKQRLTKNALTPTQQKTLHKAITYFTNHRHMMDYATYLARGFPIATGVVEGACNSLVKERMEQSGMHWSIRGAQAVLDQRAVMKNGDWDEFCTFFIEQERKRLYPITYPRVA
jgi:hypothetical protein